MAELSPVNGINTAQYQIIHIFLYLPIYLRKKPFNKNQKYNFFHFQPTYTFIVYLIIRIHSLNVVFEFQSAHKCFVFKKASYLVF